MLQCLADTQSPSRGGRWKGEWRRRREGGKRRGSLMGAVNSTTLQQPSFSSSASQQKIYAGALSIPRTSRPGSAEDGADKWTASEGPGQPCVIPVRPVLTPHPPTPNGLTGRTEQQASWKSPHQGSDWMNSHPHSHLLLDIYERFSSFSESPFTISLKKTTKKHLSQLWQNNPNQGGTD